MNRFENFKQMKEIIHKINYDKMFFTCIIAFFISCTHASEKSETVPVSKIIKQIKKGENVFYEHSRIVGDLNFLNIMNGNDESIGEIRNYIASSITFRDCIFEGKVIAYEDKDNIYYFSQFEKNISFINCKFIQEVNFRDVQVDGSINFTDSEFNEPATFEGICGKGKTISFNNCVFNETSRFQRAVFLSSAGFFKTKFLKDVNFQASYFYNDAIFRACTFGGKINFSSMNVLGNFSMNYTECMGEFTFQNNKVFDRAEFIHCSFKDDVHIKGNIFFSLVRFQKSVFDKKCIIKETVFQHSLPEFDETQFLLKNEIELDAVRYNTNNILKISDIFKK